MDQVGHTRAATAVISRRRAAVAAWVLAVIQAGLLVHTALDKSDTIDEPHYLAAGVAQAHGLDFRTNCDAPALPKWAFAGALRIADPEIFDPASRRGRDPLWSRRPGEVRRNLVAARGTTIALTVAAGLLLWHTALAFGPAAAVVTHALWALSPNILAHGSLATLDGWATGWLCFAIWAAGRYVRLPRLTGAALVGTAFGLAAASKITALGAAPVAIVVGAIFLRRNEPNWRVRFAGDAGAFLGALVLTVWAVYALEAGPLDTGQPCGRAASLPSVSLPWVPFPSWIGGALQQMEHGKAGHLNYLYGEVRSGGWWWFYLAALALKTRVGAQLLTGVALIARFRARARPALLDAALLGYPLLLLVVMSLGEAQGGIKYILPAFPFVMVWLGREAALVPPRLGRAGRAAVVLALAVAIVETLAVHPHHLMFFNAWAGGPDGGPRYLVVGDDWGQDQRRLGEWQARTHPWRLYYTQYSGRPEYWQVTYETPACEPRPGIYALQAVEVHRPKRLPRGCLDWLTVEPPDERLGHSIYLYQVTRARIDRLRMARGRVKPFWRSGPG